METPRIPKDRIEDCISSLVLQHDNGQVPNYAVRSVAATCGVTTRTIRRLIAQHRRSGQAYRRGRWAPTAEHIRAVAATHGNVELAYKHLMECGESLPSLSTFRRGIAAKLGSDGQAYIRQGAAAYKSKRLVLARPRLVRNEVWEMDHVELPLDVVTKGSTALCKPWLTSAIDVSTRMVMGACLTFGSPTAEVARSVVLHATQLRVTDDGIAIGGRPATIKVDRGQEFMSKVFARLLAELNITYEILPPRTPERKGTIERWHRTLETRWCSVIPGFTHGAEDALGKRPSRSNPLDEEGAAAYLKEAIGEYNFETEHSSIKSTPYEAWCDDATPLDPVPEHAYLCGLLRATKPRILQPTGINFHKRRYLAPELEGRVGQSFEVGYLPLFSDYIELFQDRTHVCTAFDVEQMTEEQRMDILAQRSDRARAFGHLLTARTGKLRRSSRSDRKASTRRRTTADELKDAHDRVLAGDFDDDGD